MKKSMVLPLTLKFDEKEKMWTAEVKNLGISHKSANPDFARAYVSNSVQKFIRTEYGQEVITLLVPVSMKYEVRIATKRDRSLDEFEEYAQTVEETFAEDERKDALLPLKEEQTDEE